MKKQEKKKMGSRKTGNQTQAVALSSSKSYAKPVLSTKGMVTTIKKCEFVKNLTPSDPFTVETIVVNPANEEMFPWLHSVSPGWEKFRIKKLVFEYRTAQSTLVPGMVMLAPEFNVQAPPPDTKEDFLEYAYAQRGPIWENFRMDVPVGSVMNYKEYYIWDGLQDPTPLLYNPMFLCWATDSVSTDVAYVGELWVDYEIELLYPQKLSDEAFLGQRCQSIVLGTSFTGQTTPFIAPGAVVGNVGASVQNSSDIFFSKAFSGTLLVFMAGTTAQFASFEEPGVNPHPVTYTSSGAYQPSILTTFGPNSNVQQSNWSSYGGTNVGYVSR